jgi:hypothetical protein
MPASAFITQKQSILLAISAQTYKSGDSIDGVVLDCEEAQIYFASAADLRVRPRFAAFSRAQMRHSGATGTERCIKKLQRPHSPAPAGVGRRGIDSDFGPSPFCPSSRSFPLSFSQSGRAQALVEMRIPRATTGTVNVARGNLNGTLVVDGATVLLRQLRNDPAQQV